MHPSYVYFLEWVYCVETRKTGIDRYRDAAITGFTGSCVGGFWHRVQITGSGAILDCVGNTLVCANHFVDIFLLNRQTLILVIDFVHFVVEFSCYTFWAKYHYYTPHPAGILSPGLQKCPSWLSKGELSSLARIQNYKSLTVSYRILIKIK